MSFIKILKYAVGTPMGMLFTAVSATVISTGLYRYVLRPRLDRQKRIEAENFAQYLFEKELEGSPPR